MIDQDRLAELASRDPRLHAHNEMGAEGAAMVGRLIERVRAIYRVLSPEQLTEGITVVEPLSPSDEPSCAVTVQGKDIHGVDELPDYYRECVTVIAMPGSTLRTSGSVLAPSQVAATDAVY